MKYFNFNKSQKKKKLLSTKFFISLYFPIWQIYHRNFLRNFIANGNAPIVLSIKLLKCCVFKKKKKKPFKLKHGWKQNNWNLNRHAHWCPVIGRLLWHICIAGPCSFSRTEENECLSSEKLFRWNIFKIVLRVSSAKWFFGAQKLALGMDGTKATP